MSADALLTIAEDVCAATGTRIKNYPALVSLAALSAPRLRGCPLYATEHEQARTIRLALRSFPPLEEHNDIFADVLFSVLAERHAHAAQPPTRGGTP
ncbi:hypothetical protein L1O03_10650 [Corynebacterium uropygiale]|uniref:Uncharacterized protein n=1 Tax=Corynebacterium uropygiale TaxID=1775911 RepID=A0A9X1QV82_9CORY|nr:hypothetical protein [Corynebacterium uropygiale]MCF4007620.1 hypothetical protein [Corynebacterium uropygiale]